MLNPWWNGGIKEERVEGGIETQREGTLVNDDKQWRNRIFTIVDNARNALEILAAHQC